MGVGLSPNVPGKETTVARIGLSLAEPFYLRVQPLAGVDPTFHNVATKKRVEMFSLEK